MADEDPYRCPDCDSETTFDLMGQPGIYKITVAHDETCPWLAARTRPPQ